MRRPVFITLLLSIVASMALGGLGAARRIAAPAAVSGGGGGGDPDYASVVYLLHGNGTDTSTTITDNSSYARTSTAFGNAQIDTAQFKYGTASILFDGAGDYTTTDGSADFAFSSGDFTIEFWLRVNATGTLAVLYDSRPTGTDGAYASIHRSSANKINYLVSSATRIFGGTTISTGQWYHVAVARTGTSTKLFLDGVQEGSTWSDSTTYLNGTSRPTLGINGNTGTQPFNGWLDDVRVTKGVCRYTTTFTPSTSQFPDN